MLIPKTWASCPPCVILNLNFASGDVHLVSDGWPPCCISHASSGREDRHMAAAMPEDQPLEVNRMGAYRWYIHPSFDDVVYKAILFWTQEIPP